MARSSARIPGLPSPSDSPVRSSPSAVAWAAWSTLITGSSLSRSCVHRISPWLTNRQVQGLLEFPSHFHTSYGCRGPRGPGPALLFRLCRPLLFAPVPPPLPPPSSPLCPCPPPLPPSTFALPAELPSSALALQLSLPLQFGIRWKCHLWQRLPACECVAALQSLSNGPPHLFPSRVCNFLKAHVFVYYISALRTVSSMQAANGLGLVYSQLHPQHQE